MRLNVDHKIEHKLEVVKEKGGCAHHWLIESAKGKNSRGVCRVCGAVKEFDNRGVDFFYDPEPEPTRVITKQVVPWQRDEEEPEWEVA